MRRYKSILITGASSGIGEALAERYAAPDIFLALSGRNRLRLEGVADKCRQYGAKVEPQVIDVTDQTAMKAWILSADTRHTLDLVIANAGVSAETTGRVETSEITQRLLDVNVQGVLNTVFPVLDQMLERNTGQVAFMSSLAGYRGLPSAPAYSASKAWAKSYAEGLRGKYAQAGIGISVICPGFVKSGITDHNTFVMPFLMDSAKAAKIIEKGLTRNKACISFPFPMNAAAWLMQTMPSSWSDRMLSYLPSKE